MGLMMCKLSGVGIRYERTMDQSNEDSRRGWDRGCYETIVENWTLNVPWEQLFPAGLMVTAMKFARPWLVSRVIADG